MGETRVEEAAAMKDILDKCLEAHPRVAAYDGIFGGAPHIRGRRFTVANVLARVHTLGSVAAVAAAYDLSEEDLKEALAFAQDFIEEAFDRIVPK